MEFLAIPFLVIFALIVIGAIVSKKKLEERRAALARLATQYGLKFIPDALNDAVPGGFWAQAFGDHSQTDERRFLSRFEALWPFGTGTHRIARDLLYGTHGNIDWAIFDYSYQTTSSNGPDGGQTTTTHPFGVICARIPVSLPCIHLSEENFLHRIGCKLGAHEMTFELEEFNRRYFIRADDERAAYDLLHPQAIEYLMTLSTRDWQFSGCQIVIARTGQYMPHEIPVVMGEIDGFVRLIPGYVKEDRALVPDWQGPFR